MKPDIMIQPAGPQRRARKRRVTGVVGGGFYMVKKLSIGLVLTLWLVSVVYLALLSNWFRYGFSLEAIFVAIPLVLGALISSVFALLAYHLNKFGLVVWAFILTGVSGLFVISAHLYAFGEMPSLYVNDFEKSPTGRIVTSQGEVNYRIELENPFAYSHREYIVIRRDAKEHRFKVPIFNGPVGGFVPATSAEDWGQLEIISDPDVYILTIGPNLPARGSSFRINLRTGEVETLQPIKIRHNNSSQSG